MEKNSTPSATFDLLKQQALLREEYAYEKEQYEQQTERTGLPRRIQQGLCWYPILTGRSYYNSLNQLVVEVSRTQDREVEHNFEYGRPVSFFTADLNGRLRYLSFSATISYVQDDRMVVALPSEAALIELEGKSSELGVQLYFDETSYRAMFAALDQTLAAKNNLLAHLRETLLGPEHPHQRQLFPVRFPWLNPSQEHAVNQVLGAKEVAIVHGPPGTGKTTTLVEAIYETLHRETQLLVCAQSNTAVDWISEKLVDRGIPVLRIGNPTRVNDKMLSFTYERRFESYPLYTELWSIRKAIREAQQALRKRSGAERDSLRNRLSRLRSRAAELEVEIDTALFDEARVVACTLVGAANRVLTNHHFTTLFIDEAAQALEAACWIAIGKADRVILAGDHQQLPPTVKCPEAELLVAQLKAYVEKITKERILDERIDFGLISPYKAQVQYIRSLVKRDPFFKPLRSLITIHTVDGFQGQERDVILISLVRANAEGRIGFLGDLRRMNVAMTRARMKLIILGNAETLSHHPFYRKLHAYATQQTSS